MEWALVVFFFAGAMAKGDSVALTTVAGFQSEQLCQQAATRVQRMPRGLKSGSVLCVRIK